MTAYAIGHISEKLSAHAHLDPRGAEFAGSIIVAAAINGSPILCRFIPKESGR